MRHDVSTVCVIGLGHVGLPVAVWCAGHGAVRVIGCDTQSAVVDAVNSGSATYVQETGLAAALQTCVERGTLVATTDTQAAVRRAAVVLVIVPVGLTDSLEVDFTALDAATLELGAGLQPGTLVIYESTIPVGTTRGRIAHLIESASDLRAGRDFSLAFSPERVYRGRVLADLASYPKIVGGLDAESTRRAVQFYESVLTAPVRALSTCEAAECVKLAEATYRDVNIALANELALFAEQRGLDIQEIIDAANTEPYMHLHRPGVGVGGPGVPVAPYFLFHAWDDFKLPPLARAINDAMAEHGVDMLEAALGDLEDRAVLLLGLTYRENVKDVTFSAARRLSRDLRHRGAQVLGHDPLLDDAEQRAFKLRPFNLNNPERVDAVIIQAYHDQYRGLDLSGLPGLRVVLDGRGALDEVALRALDAQGIRYYRIGLAQQAHDYEA
jgi:nucleotide sugar dehydrogenase